MPSRRPLLPALALALAGLAPAAEGRPNVVLILADDLGYGDLGCYGATRVKTPNIDRLASEGVRCTDAHAASAVCQPSRYSILSGEYASRIAKKGDYQTYFRDGQIILPAMLRSAGYRTAAIGKWHNGFGRGAEPDYNRPDFLPAVAGATAVTPLTLGFESFFGLPRSHNEPPAVLVETAAEGGRSFLRIVAGDPADPIAIHPAVKGPGRRPDDYGHGYSTGATAAHAARIEDRVDLVLADKAVEYIKDADAASPFFLYLAFNAPHVPIKPATEYVGSSQAGLYGDFVQELDGCVGRIADALHERGMDGNTLLIVTSDNGGLYVLRREMPFVDNAPLHRTNGSLNGQKTDCWEGGHRIPLIVRWPAGGIPPAATCDALIGLTDIFATVSAATGAPIPAGAARDSLDELPLLRSPAAHPPIRREMLVQGTKGYMLRWTDEQGMPWAYLPMRGSGGETVVDAPKTGRWGQSYRDLRFINSDIEIEDSTGNGRIKAGAPKHQLYDLRADPRQATNVVAQHPDLAQKLDDRLQEILKQPATLTP